MAWGRFIGVVMTTAICLAQTQESPVKAQGHLQSASDKNSSDPGADPNYQLGPGDQIVVRVLDAEQFTDRPLLIDMSGYTRLPMAGRMKLGGLTVFQAEAEVATRLKTYYKKPDVTITVAQYGSQPVSVIGNVRNPGVHQVMGRKTLVEVLSLAGGLDTNAGSTVKITRRAEYGKIPVKSSTMDAVSGFSIAEIDLKPLLEAKNPEENILIKPHDVVSVPRADTVYVMGQVVRAGGYVLNDRREVTVLQALSMAGGLDRMAKPQEARILRPESGAVSRKEIPIDLKKIIDGKVSDFPMQPEDILYIPDNIPKRAVLRTLEAAVQMGTGIAIFRR